METKFNPSQIEQAMYQAWESKGYFKPSGDNSNGAYCIMIPPPNVTGSLHMGHAFQQTIMDAPNPLPADAREKHLVASGY